MTINKKATKKQNNLLKRRIGRRKVRVSNEVPVIL
jgi:hypothetical protein